MSSRKPDQKVLQERYRIAPTLRVYDEAKPHLHPYLILNTPRNRRSPQLNTDEEGFRWTSFGGQPVTSRTWRDYERRCIMLGGSFTFGVGASCDAGTIASRLSDKLNHAFLNLGVRAGNSTQELIAAIPFLEQAQSVIICSGANNLIAALQTRGPNEIFGPFYFEQTYEALRTRPMAEIATLAQPRPWLADLAKVLRLQPRTARPADPDATSPVSAASWEHRAELAMKRQVRDLRLVAAAAAPGAQVLFAIQPFADLSTRGEMADRERDLFALHDRLQGEHWQRVRTFAISYWSRYTELILDECARLDIRAVNIAADRLHGWSFLDRVHLNDSGYDQVADLLAKEIHL